MTRRGFTSLLYARPTRPAPSRAAAETLRGRSACSASLGFGVDVGEIDFDSLGPERHQAPTHYVKAALIGLSIVAEIGRGSVGTTLQLGAMFEVVILAGPQRAAHVSTEALPRGPDPQLAKQQLAEGASGYEDEERGHAGIHQGAEKISTAIAIRSARTAAAAIEHVAQVGRLRTRLPLAEPDCGYLAPSRSATRPGRLTLKRRPALRVPAQVRAFRRYLRARPQCAVE
jgi:hypothetical protein